MDRTDEFLAALPADSAALRRMMLENRDGVARALRARAADDRLAAAMPRPAASMSLDEHHYSLTVRWTGNLGAGTSSYRGYSRDHDVVIPGLPVLQGSADPTFHGDRSRYNPEQLLLAALAQCHMLSFLHVAVRHGVVVTDYGTTPRA